jgi:hypothetical protein
MGNHEMKTRGYFLIANKYGDITIVAKFAQKKTLQNKSKETAITALLTYHMLSFQLFDSKTLTCYSSQCHQMMINIVVFHTQLMVGRVLQNFIQIQSSRRKTKI